MRVLVTGGAGFIGSAFVRHALALGWDVTVLDLLTYAGNPRNLDALPVKFVHGDIRNWNTVASAMDGCDRVVNFAAETHVDRSIEDPAPFLDTNISGVQILCDVARNLKVKRFLQVSTDEVYGEVLEGFSPETATLRPRNPYAASKAAGELLAVAHWATYGLPVVVTRAVNNFGPRQFPEKVIPAFVKRALAGQPLPIFDSGQAQRDWLHVDDHCSAISKLLMEPGIEGEVFNVGADNHQTVETIAQLVLFLTGRAMDRVTHDYNARPGHDQRYAVDSNKLRALGWAPMKSNLDELNRVIRDYVKQGPV